MDYVAPRKPRFEIFTVEDALTFIEESVGKVGSCALALILQYYSFQEESIDRYIYDDVLDLNSTDTIVARPGRTVVAALFLPSQFSKSTPTLLVTRFSTQTGPTVQQLREVRSPCGGEEMTVLVEYQLTADNPIGPLAIEDKREFFNRLVRMKLSMSLVNSLPTLSHVLVYRWDIDVSGLWLVSHVLSYLIL